MPAKKKSAAATVKPAAGKRGRKAVDPNETKEAKFVRLGSFRVSKTLNDLRNVKNLAKYPHTPEQGAKIVEALRDAVEAIEFSFSEQPKGEKPAFSL